MSGVDNHQVQLGITIKIGDYRAHFGDGAGGFRFAVGPDGRGTYGIAQGDLNSDGKTDVAAMSNGNFVVMLGEGAGNLGSPSIVPMPNASSIGGSLRPAFNTTVTFEVSAFTMARSGLPSPSKSAAATERMSEPATG